MQDVHSTPQSEESHNNNPIRITFLDLVDNDILNEIAECYNDPGSASLLLDKLRYDSVQRPIFNSPINFWSDVCKRIDQGIVEGGLEKLLLYIIQTFPGNNTFKGFLSQKGVEVKNSTKKGINLYIDGWDPDRITQNDIIEIVTRTAEELGITNGIEGLYCTGNRLSIFLYDHIDRAPALLERLRTTDMRNLDLTMSPPDSSRDYLLSTIYAEGPDQGRFQFSNIPASTRVRDVGNSMVEQYGQRWSGSGGNVQRNAVVDHITSEGVTERLNHPNATLHENNIRDGDTLQVSPESTVASYINPIIKDQALVKAKTEIEEFIHENPSVTLERNRQTIPTQYWIRFSANGRAIPVRKNQFPGLQSEHLVSIWFDAGFPINAPIVNWEKPIIFHPNVNPESGFLCLGELKDRYRPGLDIGSLCRTIIDVANYRNYQADSCLNDDAGEWAKSPEGQAEIIRYGGKAIITETEENMKKQQLPQLQIKKI